MHLLESGRAVRGRAGELYKSHLLEKPLQYLECRLLLAHLSPRFDERAVVVVVWRIFEVAGGAVFDGHLHAALALMRVPDAVVKAELYLLLHVTGEVVGSDPARVNIERGFAAVGIGVDHLKLGRVPGIP